MLAQGSTARVNLERLARPGKMGMTTSTIIAKNGLHMQSMYEYTAVRLCADRVRCPPEVSMVTE